MIRLRPDEVTLFNDLIAHRDSSHLAGRYDDEFVVVFVGTEGDLTHPSFVGHRPVSMRTLRRFRLLGLLDVLSETDAALVFDLADNFRDRWARVDPTQQDPEPHNATPLADPAATQVGVFISCAESSKLELARPFRDLLASNDIQGFIVSDEPRPDTTWTPEEKVDAFLERSRAVVVFATADIEARGDVFTRPNIADEIARARSKDHLRNRVCVLRAPGVTLPSNINPAYESLDPSMPSEAFRRALLQLREWGFPIRRIPESVDLAELPRAVAAGSEEGAGLDPKIHEGMLTRAMSLLPDRQHTGGEVSLAVIVGTPLESPIIRPAELESPALAQWLTQTLLFGDLALFDYSESTAPAMSGNSLVVRQTRSWVALDSFGTVVILRPLRRQPHIGLPAVIEEQVQRDIRDALHFAGNVLDHLDESHRISHVAPVVALIGASYGAWRNEAEHAASPNSMAVNMTGSDRPVAHLTPAVRDRGSLRSATDEMAEDLTVLLRRAASP